MRLQNNDSVFNMGDTSLRVKQQVDVYFLLLKHLSDFSYSNLSWADKIFQEEFYKSIHKEIIRLDEDEKIKFFENFQRTYTVPKADKIGKRARTWTNSLVKNGLITKNRELSSVGKNYLSNNLKPADALEALVTIDYTNLLYLRQYLKLRIYSSDSKHYFYNFRFSIKLALKYSDIPKNDFLTIIESIKPIFSYETLINIIDKYEDVQKNNVSFETYYFQNFGDISESNEKALLAKQLFKNYKSEIDLFDKCFCNRKSSSSQEPYKEFVTNLIELIDLQSIEAYKIIKTLSKKPEIKKAFGFNRAPFVFKKKETVNEFISSNSDNSLLDSDHFMIYRRFIVSKKFDLIREYSDMCFRSFQATGIFNFTNNLVNLNCKWWFEHLLSELEDNFKLCGKDEFKKYEDNDSSIWFQDMSIMEIFGINEKGKNTILSKIQKGFGLSDIESIKEHLDVKKENEYKEFVKTKFPRKTVIEVLSAINQRDDENVFKLVTENATVSTIFEYILTIAWYYISEDENYLLHKSFQLSLDGDKLPLTHRGGGAGDIEITTEKYALLIEATLMNPNTQKRGELEPVIRHSVTFKLQQNKGTVLTLFVANELDTNVVNIFRAMQFVQLQGTTIKGNVDGVNIFAITTNDLIKILKEEINDNKILDTIKENLMVGPMQIDNNWHEPIRDRFFIN